VSSPLPAPGGPTEDSNPRTPTPTSATPSPSADRSVALGAGLGLLQEPGPSRHRGPTPTGPPQPAGRTETAPSAGPTTPPRRQGSTRPLSLRTLDEAWREQSTPETSAAVPGRSTVPVESATAPAGGLAATGAGLAPTRPLDQVTELAGADVDLESTLMTMLERGLRAEARRYGVDLDGWEIQ